MEETLSLRFARTVVDLRAIARLLTEAGNPADAVRLQGFAATVREIEGELLAAERQRAIKANGKRRR